MTIPVSPLPPLVGRERDSVFWGGASMPRLLGGAAWCSSAARRGSLAFVGRCYDLTETPPYGPWIELFGGYQPADGMPPPGRSAFLPVGPSRDPSRSHCGTASIINRPSTAQPIRSLRDDS